MDDTYLFLDYANDKTCLICRNPYESLYPGRGKAAVFSYLFLRILPRNTPSAAKDTYSFYANKRDLSKKLTANLLLKSDNKTAFM